MIVAEDACTELSDESHRAALQTFALIFGRVRRTEQIVELFAAAEATAGPDAHTLTGAKEQEAEMDTGVSHRQRSSICGKAREDFSDTSRGLAVCRFGLGEAIACRRQVHFEHQGNEGNEGPSE